jgi:competence protein ComEA
MGFQRPDTIALVGLGAAAVLAVVSVSRAHRAPPPVQVSAPAAAAQISVHVTGEVVWPGLYVLKAGSRVRDALFAARGPTLMADLGRVNLAVVVRDGDRVVIPRRAQPPYPFEEALAQERAEKQAQETARARAGGRHRPSGTSGVPARPLSAASSQEGRDAAGEASPAVNVNTATAADLERLPGVGPVLARRIVEFRDAKGLFRRLEDLQEVEGVGPKLYRRIQPFLRLDDGTPGKHPP